MIRKISYYGWQPDLPDQRDFQFRATPPSLKALPAKVDMRTKCPPVYDQGDLGSCTGNAIAGAIQFELMKQKAKTFIPSRLFIYYNERVMERTVNIDNGAEIRDGMKSVNKKGVCPEPVWPYIITRFAKKPSDDAFTAALNHQVLSYQRVSRTLNQFKGCLAAGFPFVFGFTVYDSFESDAVANSGILNMPGADEKVVGGHAVLAVGYNDNTNRFVVRNSWGRSWGAKGYFTIPYDYLMNENLSSDFWTIRMVEENPALKRIKKK